MQAVQIGRRENPAPFSSVVPKRPLKPESASATNMPFSSIVLHVFFFGNLTSPILSPLSTTLRTLSIVPSSFWSGAAVPRSKSATIVGVVLHLVARSFWVMVVPLSFFASPRAFLMASPTRVPTVLGLIISSDRSTFVRCCPSTAGFVAW